VITHDFTDFPSAKFYFFSQKLNTTTKIGVAMKTFGAEF